MVSPLKNIIKKYSQKKTIFDFSTLIQELKIRGYSLKTSQIYVYYNQKFLLFTKKNILEINSMDVRQYLEYLIDKKLSRATIRLIYNSLLFYYSQILGKKIMVKIKIPKRELKTIVVLTKEEVQRLLTATTNPKHKLLLEILYSSGLRVSEVVKLKFNDFHPKEKILIVRCGKGRKDRKVIISEKILNKINFNQNPNNYLFPGRNNKNNNNYNNTLTIRSVQKIIKNSAKKAKITKNVHPHTLRHSFATHLLDNNVNTKKIQKLLGHKNSKTTDKYLHISTADIKNIQSPHDNL